MSDNYDDIVLPKLRCKSKGTDHNYSSDFKFIYESAMDVVQKRHKRLSQKKFDSISPSRTIER